MSNSSQMPLSTVETGEEYEGYDSMSTYANRSEYTRDYTPEIIVISVCILGLVGNGIIICLLGFCIKRSSFTTYILNLAVADFGVLTAALGTNLLPIVFKYHIEHLVWFFHELFNVTYTAGQFLLTVIGIDRCVLVFFPIWHRCHQPPHLSTIVSTIIWVISLLVCELPFILHWNLEFDYWELCFFMNALLCLPLLSISTLALFIKVHFKSQRRKWGKLLVAISLSLLFFLIFAFPFNVIYILNYFYSSAYRDLYIWGFFCTSINSSVNPVIYFLIGRKKRSRTRESLKVILQRVFKEEENGGRPPVQMSALMSP
ncbi:PREDICTED: mas-related G-protein coupled receptor member H-like [Gekko japonicus]|uniref:Mas-related G-protein coupled receptor member H-like n=1 Tax=Gekko japonicus TaxID=146911 RepID=A0ABM1KH32_GEKJA|nr:PREDICTED: mas-related G-protein coupled receptor member H-like [Gekko japonicus]